MKRLYEAPCTEKAGQIAFWSYDNYPYVLGGTVVDISVSGNVMTQEYGPGYRFRPLAILPPEQGLPIKEKLEALRNEYREATRVMSELFTAKVVEAAPFMQKHFR